MLKIARTPLLLAAVAAVAATTGAFACAQQADKNLTGSIKVDGSSTVAPITQAVDEAWREAGSRVKTTVGISGTGGGFKRFATGEIDIADASRPIKKDELDQAKKNNIEFIEIPVAYDGLSIVVNPANYWVEKLTVDDLRKIFGAGRAAKTWKDVNPAWPDNQIKIFSPGTDSGTFDYFREEVVGKDGAIRSDMSVSENDNDLVRGVAGDENAIGFFGYAYYAENTDQLKVVAIDGGTGAIVPSSQTIEDGTYAPFSRPLFIYVNKQSAQRPEVKAFVNFYLTEGPALAKEVGYVQLPKAIMDKARANWQQQKLGTQFLNDKGEKVSGTFAKVYN